MKKNKTIKRKMKLAPTKDEVANEADIYSDKMKYENIIVEGASFEGFIAGAEWMLRKVSGNNR